MDEHGVVRVMCRSPMPGRIDRYLEVHFHHRILLMHQFDRLAPLYRPSEAEGFHLADGSWTHGADDRRHYAFSPPAKQTGFVHPPPGTDATPLHLKPLTVYGGLDIPAKWLLAMKMVQWPMSCRVPEHVRVFRYEFFADSPVLEKITNGLFDPDTLGQHEQRFKEDPAMHEMIHLNEPDLLGDWDPDSEVMGFKAGRESMMRLVRPHPDELAMRGLEERSKKGLVPNEEGLELQMGAEALMEAQEAAYGDGARRQALFEGVDADVANRTAMRREEGDAAKAWEAAQAGDAAAFHKYESQVEGEPEWLEKLREKIENGEVNAEAQKVFEEVERELESEAQAGAEHHADITRKAEEAFAMRTHEIMRVRQEAVEAGLDPDHEEVCANVPDVVLEPPEGVDTLEEFSQWVSLYDRKLRGPATVAFVERKEEEEHAREVARFAKENQKVKRGERSVLGVMSALGATPTADNYRHVKRVLEQAGPLPAPSSPEYGQRVAEVADRLMAERLRTESAAARDGEEVVPGGAPDFDDVVFGVDPPRQEVRAPPMHAHEDAPAADHGRQG
eukprot:TRINITY_DN11703_c0_g1_i1.p2 TRINITY_DN11703_c0_g1~~TRINITY_DN11703_c0_g1_i1.p2  ORF type:complete len:560 (+),score=241.26 TRINITY_DN11703_c0_g1_i1:3-1682(+)